MSPTESRLSVDDTKEREAGAIVVVVVELNDASISNMNY